MSQVMAMFNRILKELVREKIVLFWTVAFPIIWLVMANIVFLANVPPDEPLGGIKGLFTLSMITYAIMIAGMVDLPGNIADDRESGMFLKLKSMPVNPMGDFFGRVLAFTAFSLLAILAVMVTGLLMGAHFSISAIAVAQSLFFFLLTFFASAGIGLIIGSLIKRSQGAVFTGIGIALVTSFLSGIFTGYVQLPDYLKDFSRIYPISACNSSLVYLLEGQNLAGYNPLEVSRLMFTILSSLLLFGVGLVLYSKYCWKKE